jgi:hypothetical protein
MELVEGGFYRFVNGTLKKVDDFCLECWSEGWREGFDAALKDSQDHE